MCVCFVNSRDEHLMVVKIWNESRDWPSLDFLFIFVLKIILAFTQRKNLEIFFNSSLDFTS